MSRKILKGKALRKFAKDRLEKNQKLFSKFSSTEKHLESHDVEAASGPELDWGVFEKSLSDQALVVIPWDAEDQGAEIRQLAATLGLKVVDEHFTRKYADIHPATYLGQGTLEKLRDRAGKTRAGVFVFDCELSPGQVRNLEDFFKKPVLDREALILMIFKHHAKSSLAKMQVELAHLKYLQPRLAGLWLGLSRQSGGKGGRGGRGLGETRLELDRRTIKNRISQLTRKLKDAEKVYKVQSSRRSRHFRVAIVGYTNAGKSTLMKWLTKAPVESKNELFSTLDTTVRPLLPPTEPTILVSDTVGFVKKLPHNLVASFKSTLSEALESQLLLIVVDQSSEFWLEQYEESLKVLENIGAAEQPKLVVLNKEDRVPFLARLRQGQILRGARDREDVIGVVSISALKKEGLSKLREKILEFFNAEEKSWHAEVGKTKGVQV